MLTFSPLLTQIGSIFWLLGSVRQFLEVDKTASVLVELLPECDLECSNIVANSRKFIHSRK